MDLNKIENCEMLYRAVLYSYPERFINGKPSAALFIDEGGASVERDGERDEPTIIAKLRKRFKNYGGYEASLKITAGECREIDVYPNPIHNDRNIYHAELHESQQIKEISLLKAMQLAARCEVVK